MNHTSRPVHLSAAMLVRSAAMGADDEHTVTRRWRLVRPDGEVLAASESTSRMGLPTFAFDEDTGVIAVPGMDEAARPPWRLELLDDEGEWCVMLSRGTHRGEPV